MSREFAALDLAEIGPTRDALHAWARVLGDCLKRARPKRKHWWHASLRPSLRGLSTGVIHAQHDAELELDLRNSLLHVRLASGVHRSEPLSGQSVAQFAAVIRRVLAQVGIDNVVPEREGSEYEVSFDGYRAEQADVMGRVLADVTACMAALRAELREEASPIQLWPHHFDLSMLWLPGSRIADQDPDNEEYADKQMNFGFAFGDEAIAEPYLYVTAYPLTADFPAATLPAGAQWKSDGFSGAVLPYARLREQPDPSASLLQLWRTLHAVGKTSLMHPEC